MDEHAKKLKQKARNGEEITQEDISKLFAIVKEAFKKQFNIQDN